MASRNDHYNILKKKTKNAKPQPPPPPPAVAVENSSLRKPYNGQKSAKISQLKQL